MRPGFAAIARGPAAWHAIWRASVVAGVAGACLIQFTRPTEALFVGAFLGIEAAAAVAAWVIARGAPRAQRLPGRLVAAGLTSNVVGEAVWYSFIVDDEFRDASFADVGWLMAYVFFASALWISLVRSQKQGRVDVDTVIDGLTIVTVSVLVLWNVSVDAIAGDPSLTPVIKGVWSIYPIADAILLALVIRILTNRRARNAVDGWFGVGVVLWLIADLGFLMLPLTEFNEGWENSGWLIGAVLMARALGSGPTLARPADDRESDTHFPRLAIAILPLVVPPVLVLVDVARGDGAQPVQLAIGTGILLLLAFVRTARLLRSEREARHDLAMARDAALEGSRTKSTFLATMSHEIRTPMNGIIGLTGLLLDTPLDERQRQYAEGVRGAGEALLTIINDILDFSKAEAGRLELEEIDFSLLQIVEEVGELVADSAQGKGLELIAYCSPELPLGLRGDPSRLRQVLLNLASNAVKFTARGEVVLSAHLQDRTSTSVVVRFEVSDTGVGIDTGDRERVFEAFSQADSSTTREFGGTGLGLAISRQLVTAMGGTIGVDSEPGAGSTFCFTLPFDLAPDTTISPGTSTHQLGDRLGDRLVGLRVLVVDDNATNRLVLSQQLSAWGMRVDVAKDGPSALPAVARAAEEQAPYDLALLDLSMPVMDGIELAARITGNSDLAGPGLVLLTSDEGHHRAASRAAGITARLSKPVHLGQLQAILAEVAGTSSGAVERTPQAPLVKGRGHLLVAEDNEVNQLVAVGILEHLGYTCDVVANGLEALEALAGASFDAVLMDCQMPQMDGFQATAELRRIELGQTRHTPVIAMTAGVSEGERAHCAEVGMDGFVSKPVSVDALDDAISRSLALRIS